MSAIFSSEKGAAKKHKLFIFLKGCYFVMSSPIDMNVDMLWGLSKKCGAVTFPEI